MWQDKKYQFVSLIIYLYEDHLVWNEVTFAGREVTLYYTDIISVAGGNPIRVLGLQDNSRFEINTAGQNYTYASPLGPFQGVEECMQIINERIQHYRNNGAGSANSAGFANRININPDNIEPTITRINIFLEDGEWDKVIAYANAALDYFPTDYRLYKYLLLADMKCKSISDLKKCSSSFASNGNYKKLDRYADESLKKELKEILKYVENEPIYRQACGTTDKKKAAELFGKIKGYKDSSDRITTLQNKIRAEEKQQKEKEEQRKNEKYLAAVELHNKAETLDDYKKALDAFEELNDLTYEDSQYRYAAIKRKYDELVREKEYSDAINLLSSGEVSKARAAKKVFDKLQDYEDSKGKAVEAQSIIAAADKKRKKVLILAACILAVVLIFTTIVLPMMSRNSLVQKYGESTVEKFSGLKAGDTFTLGTYEQDNNTSNGAEDIEWLVLDKKGNKVLAVSVYLLDCRTFHTEHAEVTWETCELRKWLNTEFFSSAFTQEEQKLIPEVLVSADENPEFSTDPGNDTKDRVFLLSVPEVNKYLGTNYDCYSTSYVDANNYGGTTWWWLRSPGDDSTSHALVDCYGDRITYNPCLQKGGIRPTIWVSLN